MATRSTVLVLMGGPDAERRISIMSGKEVAQALRDGGRFEVIEQVIDVPSAAELSELGGDVVFPVLHGHFGEGGPLQELLELVGLPYVGSGPAASAAAMDKLAAKSILSSAGAPTPPARRLEPADPCDLGPPLVLKPIDDGSSVDLVICRTDREIQAGRALLHGRRGAIMAERYISGREITVGIVGRETLPAIEIIPGHGVEFYDYQAKYFRDDTRYVIDPDLPGGVAAQCRSITRLAFDRLGCRDVARADFVVDGDGPWFLEINTMPGFTTHSLVPMAAARRGVKMAALCEALVDMALARAPAIAER